MAQVVILPKLLLRDLLWQAWSNLAKKYQLKKNLFKKEQIKIEYPANPKFGDYATNISIIAFKKLESPVDLGKLLVKELRSLSSLVKKENLIPWAKIEFVSPGFINFYLSSDYLFQLAKAVFESKALSELKKIGRGKTMVIDYSSPNIARSFGVGHLRSTNIGQAIYNLYQALGWRVIGDNHLGDWGTQFGALIYQILRQKNKKELTIADLERLYVEFHQEAEKNPLLIKKARLWFKKLESSETKARNIWRLCLEISKKEFQRIYQLLGVKFDYELGESFYQDKMAEVLSDAKKKGILVKSRGALVIRIPGAKTPGMLVKSDGATTYLLRDLATIKYRLATWKPDLIVYEVGADQKLHFKQLFALAEMLGYCPREKLVYLAHGLIRWKGGKFSTRKGQTIHLEEVIQEAIKKASKIIAKSETSKNLTEKEKQLIAQKVGIGGVKFNDLKQEPEKGVVFDWNKILSLEGYSACYLQYTLARCFSILDKAGKTDFDQEKALPKKLILSSEEETLLRTFYRFPEIIQLAAKEFSPHFLAGYLFGLAQKFNWFYQKRRILNEKNKRNWRLFLTATTAKILACGLEILGVPVLKKM